MVAGEVESSCQLVVTFFFFFFLVSPYQTIEISLGQPSPPLISTTSSAAALAYYAFYYAGILDTGLILTLRAS